MIQNEIVYVNADERAKNMTAEERKAGRRGIPVSTKNEIFRMYNAGKKIKNISRKYAVSVTTVHNVLHIKTL